MPVLARMTRPAGRLVHAFRTRRYLRLRTKVSLAFGLIALVAGVSVAVVAYTFARSSLLDQRAAEARQSAINNATNVFGRLEASDEGEMNEYLTRRVSGSGFIVVVRDGEMFAAAPPTHADPTIFPADLRESVANGEAATQRFRHNNRPYVGVGMPLGHDARYFEAFSLQSTEQTLRNILLTFTLGSTLAVLLFGAAGIWFGRRLLRPLGTVTNAAGEIAAGDLTTRVAPQRDADLEPLVDAFNGMADAVQARVERETRFVSDVSHELRSPITALQAATEILERRRDEFDDRPRQAVDVIIDQVRRFDGMVLDLLELSRIDAGAADLHVEVVDIADAAHRVSTHHGTADVPIDVDPAAPRFAQIDRIRLERILGNLLENAKNHANGPTRISIEPDVEAEADGEAGFLVMAVEDDGPGVEESERERIFGRFARGAASRHRVGTGLGLALVAEHAAALGGRAWVEDRPGGGARFVVRLPAARAAEPRDVEPGVEEVGA